MSLPWPAANAKLLDLRGPGAMDDHGDVTDEAAVALWQGEIEAQLQRDMHTVISGGQNTPVEGDVLIIRKPPTVVARAEPGDQGVGNTVLVRDERTAAPVTSRFRIVRREHRGKGESESVRFELADERQP